MDLTRITSKFNFHQQIRILLCKLRNANTPAAEILDSKLHMTSTLSMGAPDGHIANIEQAAPEGPINITLWQNGLTGAAGALPTVYSEWMIERHYRYGDHSMKAFLDIFNHRLYCLDYLAWQKNHLYAHAESNEQFPLQLATLALTGLLTSPSMFDGGNYAHLFSAPVRSLVNLEVWLSHYYCTPVHITPFTGGWKSIDKREHCKLGSAGQTLETAPMIGRTRWEVQSHFDVTLGPMPQNIARHFIPEGKFYRDIWLRIREYIGPVLDFTIHLSINNRNNMQAPLGAGQLGIDIYIGQSTTTRLHQIFLPEYKA